MNDKLAGRLLNWKFSQARQYLDEEPPQVRELVQALATLLGDCGWGLDGTLAVIVEAALRSLEVVPVVSDEP